MIKNRKPNYLEIGEEYDKLLVEYENLELVIDGLVFDRNNLRSEVDGLDIERDNLAEENANFANYLEAHEYSPCEIDNIAGGWKL